MKTELQKDIDQTACAFNKRHHWGIDEAAALAEEVMTDANAHAEVRLWKAAPELLAALRIVASTLTGHHKPTIADLNVMQSAAWGAIAKAEGRAE